MKNDLIERIWREAPEEQPMSHEQLIGVLEPRVERSSRRLYAYVWTYLLLQMATLLLAGANLIGYRTNPVMLGVEIGIAVLALGFAAFGVHLHGEVRRLERMDETLATTLRRRLVFYRSNASIWMWLSAFSLVAFTFALNSLIDNANGHYPINHPLVFVGIQIAMLLIFVAAFHLAHEPHLRELRAVLADLEAQVLDRTEAVDGDLARWKRYRMALAALLMALLALGIWMAWRASS